MPFARHHMGLVFVAPECEAMPDTIPWTCYRGQFGRFKMLVALVCAGAASDMLVEMLLTHTVGHSFIANGQRL